jgi:hypothetical protein
MAHRLRRTLPTCVAIAFASATACGSAAPAEAPPTNAPRMCTLMAYTQGLDIDVLGAGADALPWTVEVTARGETHTVEVKTSESGAALCGAGATNADLGCAARGALVEVAVTPPLGTLPARIRVANADGDRIGGPAELTVRVSHGDRSGSATLRPTYTSDEPNGAGCGVRTAAKATIELAP